MKIKYNMDLMKFMSLFESLTGAKLKDCFEDRFGLTFIVHPGEAGKAIGKRASNIMRLEGILKRKIRVVEFSEKLTDFVRNIVMPLRVESVEENDGIVTIRGQDMKTRGLLIGRDAQNLRNLEGNVQRYFPIKEIKVV